MANRTDSLPNVTLLDYNSDPGKWIRYLVRFDPPLDPRGVDFSDGIELERGVDPSLQPIRFAWIQQFKGGTSLIPSDDKGRPVAPWRGKASLISHGPMDVNAFLRDIGRGSIRTVPNFFGKSSIEPRHARGEVIFTEAQYEKHHARDAKKIALGALAGALLGYAIGRNVPR